MQKFFCAIGFLTIVLIFQDCLVPAQGVRVRVVKVKRDNHYTKRQVSRTTYTDVPLTGDPDPDAESFRVNNNNALRPEDNPYNAGNRPVDYPLNNNYDTNVNANQAANYDETNYDQQQPAAGQFGSRDFVNNNNNVNTNRGFVAGSHDDGSSRAVVNNNGNRRQSADQQIPPRRKEGEKEGDCPGCGNSIPGEAGVDYPNFHTPPKTAFSCSKQSYSGYYADVEARCQVFWICQKNRADAFLCPNGTIFNQQVFVCDWWFNSDCNTAPDYYSRNQYLYAGPAVDLFGNAITPYKQPSTPKPVRRSTEAPVRLQSLDQLPAQQQQQQVQQQVQRQPQTQRVAQPAVTRLQNKAVVQPQRQQQPIVQPQRQQQPIIQPQRQSQRVPTQSVSGGYGSSVPIRRNDYDISATAAPVARQYPQSTIKRSQQPVKQQTYNSYPVPDNSLAAVDQDFGLKMNNYKAAVDYINSDVQQTARQQQSQKSYDAQSQRQYYSGTANNNAGYQQQRQSGYAGNNKNVQTKVTGGYGSRATDTQQYQRQPLFSSAEEYEVDTTDGFGQKKQRSNIIVQTVQPQTYSSTTKRNAIDYDTENTTPFSTSHDDELLSTISTPRYGEVVSRPSIYSTESEVQSQETTTAAPLTFGQKLTRAAKKRNTSTWGNWKTMLLGDY